MYALSGYANIFKEGYANIFMQTLYFSSDMPGSLGGVDIWKVAVNSDGSYGTVSG